MIEPYYGEFLINPIPLELSLNFCSHKCGYCFANLNNPGRKLNAPRLMRFLADYRNRDTLPATLLKAGYPVVMSNRVDPFANSNFQQTLPILELLAQLGIPVQFQTRGGKGIEDALKIVGPSVWYVSITFQDDAQRRAVEPGAPSIPARLDLISQLTDHGHHVVAGLNPLVPDWIPDPEPLLDQIQAAGAWGVWIERLHLNTDQIKNMSDREQDAIGQDLLAAARRRKCAPAHEAHITRARDYATGLGLHVYSVGQPVYSDFFDIYHRTYPATFPTMQDWINYCYRTYMPGDIISFNDFSEFMTPHLPHGQHRISHYLGATARTLWKQYHIPNEMTYRQLLGILWDQPTIKTGIAKSNNFAYAAQRDNENLTVLIDDIDELPYMVFLPWVENYYMEVEV